MAHQNVASREYKVMLRPDAFAGDEGAALAAAGRFWTAFEEVIRPHVLDTDGKLDEVKERRAIRFLDTASHDLNRSGYILRERRGDDRELTLKFRHQDRYLTQSRDMDAAEPSRGKSKFEEDIKPPRLCTLYSFSTTQPIGDGRTLDRMEDAFHLYPGLGSKLGDTAPGAPLTTVGFEVREIVVEGADFQIGEDPKVEAECALILWYGPAAERSPFVAEFSFKYEENAFRGGPAGRAYDAFQALQPSAEELLFEWIAPRGSLTKTQAIYGAARR